MNRKKEIFQYFKELACQKPAGQAENLDCGTPMGNPIIVSNSTKPGVAKHKCCVIEKRAKESLPHGSPAASLSVACTA
jgi:hypothetical protein